MPAAPRFHPRLSSQTPFEFIKRRAMDEVEGASRAVCILVLDGNWYGAKARKSYEEFFQWLGGGRVRRSTASSPSFFPA